VRGGCGNSTEPWQFFRISVMCVQSQAPQIWQVLAPSLLVLLTYICEFAIALTTSKQTMFSALHNFSYVVGLWLQIIASQAICIPVSVANPYMQVRNMGAAFKQCLMLCMYHGRDVSCKDQNTAFCSLFLWIKFCWS
jgi:hypothetical protein